MGLLLVLAAVVALVIGCALHRELQRVGRRPADRSVSVTISLNVSAFNEAMRKAGTSIGALERRFPVFFRKPSDPLLAANRYRKGGLPHEHVVDARDYEEA